jgi:hypothetical protein
MGTKAIKRWSMACLAVLAAGCAGVDAKNLASPTRYTQERVARDLSARPEYAAFLKAGMPYAIIPGLAQDFIPQGLAFDTARNWMLVSGYRGGGRKSMLFILDAATGSMVGKVVFELPDGSAYAGHAGGVAVTGADVYISSDAALYRCTMAALEAAVSSSGVSDAEPGVVRFADSTMTPTRASFCSASAGVLWVGDFEHGAGYPTGNFRHMQARDGTDHRAWIVGYRLKPGETLAGHSVDSRGFVVPDLILSVGSRIQGMAVVAGGSMALSRSFGRNDPSSIVWYVDPTRSEPHARVRLGNSEVPLWFLDRFQERKTMIAPPMSEGLAEMGGRVHVLFESGAVAYRTGAGRARDPIDRIWTIDPRLFLE